MQLRMRSLGTEKKPNEGDHTQNNNVIFIGGDTKDFVEGLRRVREAAKMPIEVGDGRNVQDQSGATNRNDG